MRRGIDSQLFDDIRAALKAQGFGSLMLKCPAVSEEALAFWENQGFKSKDTEADTGSVVMVREI